MIERLRQKALPEKYSKTKAYWFTAAIFAADPLENVFFYINNTFHFFHNTIPLIQSYLIYFCVQTRRIFCKTLFRCRGRPCPTSANFTAAQWVKHSPPTRRHRAMIFARKPPHGVTDSLFRSQRRVTLCFYL